MRFKVYAVKVRSKYLFLARATVVLYRCQLFYDNVLHKFLYCINCFSFVNVALILCVTAGV